MATEYISTETGCQYLRKYKIEAGTSFLYDEGFNDGIETAISCIGNEIPAADVRPVVKAHWIYHEDDYGDFYECSHCHDEYVVYESDMEWKFCPTCGAEMSDSQTLKDAAQDADCGAMAPAT